MYNALCNSLGRSGGSVQDPQAADYVASVVAAGATVTSAQTAAINQFYKTAKTAGYYTSLKRMYLPIWGVAAANAICMISGTSGTFSGSVTHAAGYVQGDGSTGHFNFGVSPSTLGMTTSSGFVTALVYEADSVPTSFAGMVFSRQNAGTAEGDTGVHQTNVAGVNGWVGRPPLAGTPADFVPPAVNGIFSVSRTSTTSLIGSRRSESGYSSFTQSEDASTFPISNLAFVAMAFNAGGSAALFHDGKFGAWGAGLGLADANTQLFTAHLKTLFETCTGLTLP